MLLSEAYTFLYSLAESVLELDLYVTLDLREEGDEH